MSDWDHPHWSPPPLSPPSASHDEAPPSDASAASSRDDSPRLRAAAPPVTVVASQGGSSSPMSSAAAVSDAAGPSRDPFFFPSSLKRINEHIYEYLKRIGLGVLASLFLAEAEKNVQGGVPPVQFVRSWLRLDSKLTVLPSAHCDKREAMLALNQGIVQYLLHLNIDTDEFNERAWKLPNHQVRLIEIWVDRIYPRINLPAAGNNAG